MQIIKLFFLAASILLLSNCGKDDDTIPSPQQPKALFSVSTQSAKVGEIISFMNQSLYATRYEWDFGDGNISTEKDPTHSYSTSGSFTITLTAMGNGDAHSFTRSIDITVPLIPPSGTYIGSTAEGGSIRFSINGDEVTNFSGSYFISDGTTIYELSTSIPSFGTMTETSSGFKVTNYWGKTLTGTFENNTITGTWEHDAGTTNYSVDKQ